MTKHWKIPAHNGALTADEREAVLAHAAAQIAAEIRGLDAIGQVQLLVSLIGVPLVLGSWAADRIATLEQRLAEVEAKAAAAKPRARP